MFRLYIVLWNNCITVVTEKLQDPCKTRFKIYSLFWLSYNDPNVISPLDFPIFSIDLYLWRIFIYILFWWGWQGGETGNYESKDRGLTIYPIGDPEFSLTFFDE